MVGVNGGRLGAAPGRPRPGPWSRQRSGPSCVAALGAVDYVAVFEEATAERLAGAVRPDVYVKGADYAAAGGAVDPSRLPEAAVVQGGGGRVVLVPLTPDRSTSGLVDRIREAARAGGLP